MSTCKCHYLSNYYSVFTNWNKNLTETLTNLFLYNYSLQSSFTWLPREESPWKILVFKVRNQIFSQQIDEKQKNYASEKEWTINVTFDEELLPVAADCCRKGRWRNLFQVSKPKYLLPYLIEDRMPTDRSTLTCTEINVLMKFFFRCW